jgi:hypothetical protein
MNPELKLAVDAMLKQDGFYILKCDEVEAGAFAPLWVTGGKIYAVIRAQEIRADGFLEGAKIVGPVWRFPFET